MIIFSINGKPMPHQRDNLNLKDWHILFNCWGHFRARTWKSFKWKITLGVQRNGDLLVLFLRKHKLGPMIFLSKWVIVLVFYDYLVSLNSRTIMNFDQIMINIFICMIPMHSYISIGKLTLNVFFTKWIRMNRFIIRGIVCWFYFSIIRSKSKIQNREDWEEVTNQTKRQIIHIIVGNKDIVKLWVSYITNYDKNMYFFSYLYITLKLLISTPVIPCIS